MNNIAIIGYDNALAKNILEDAYNDIRNGNFSLSKISESYIGIYITLHEFINKYKYWYFLLEEKQ